MRALRRRLGRARLALAAAIAGPGAVLIPYRGAPNLEPRTYPSIATHFAAAEASFEDMLVAAERHIEYLHDFAGPPPEPRWDQDWFPRLDGAIAYALLRETCPERIVEIGSGHSTRFMMRAVRDTGHQCDVTCIDPSPRAEIGALPVRHLPQLVQEAPAELFSTLGPGDVLFIDSSHVALAGSDVELLLGEIVPTLQEGVVVHIHDIFLPDPYPADWRWRCYNEQGVAAALINAGLLEPLFASHYIATRMGERLRASPLSALPLLPGARETSFWGCVRRQHPDQRSYQKVSGR